MCAHDIAQTVDHCKTEQFQCFVSHTLFGCVIRFLLLCSPVIFASFKYFIERVLFNMPGWLVVRVGLSSEAVLQFVVLVPISCSYACYR